MIFSSNSCGHTGENSTGPYVPPRYNEMFCDILVHSKSGKFLHPSSASTCMFTKWFSQKNKPDPQMQSLPLHQRGYLNVIVLGVVSIRVVLKPRGMGGGGGGGGGEWGV